MAKQLKGGTRKANQGSNWIRREKRLAIYRRDNHTCVYCGRDLATEVATLDHVLACELGGTNHESNLVTACLSCNSAKRDLPLSAFLSTLTDRGVDPQEVKRAIRNQTSRKLVK
jgi:5-methylcytosine-specific restriction endonuclease McrA